MSARTWTESELQLPPNRCARTTPVMYMRHGDEIVLVPSNVGNPDHPHWFQNLLANPTVTLAIGRESATREARVATGDERSRMWDQLLEHAPTYSVYAERPATATHGTGL